MYFLINKLIDYVPFGDRLVSAFSSSETEDKRTAKISLAEEKNRIRVAKSMQKAIENKNLSSDLENAIEKMEISALENIALETYEQNKYFLNQIAKILFIVNFMASTPFLSAGLIIAGAKNAYDYSVATPHPEKAKNCLNAFTKKLILSRLKKILIRYLKKNPEGIKKTGIVILNTLKLLKEGHSASERNLEISFGFKKIIFNSTSNIEVDNPLT